MPYESKYGDALNATVTAERSETQPLAGNTTGDVGNVVTALASASAGRRGRHAAAFAPQAVSLPLLAALPPGTVKVVVWTSGTASTPRQNSALPSVLRPQAQKAPTLIAELDAETHGPAFDVTFFAADVVAFTLPFCSSVAVRRSFVGSSLEMFRLAAGVAPTAIRPVSGTGEWQPLAGAFGDDDALIAAVGTLHDGVLIVRMCSGDGGPTATVLMTLPVTCAPRGGFPIARLTLGDMGAVATSWVVDRSLWWRIAVPVHEPTVHVNRSVALAGLGARALSVNGDSVSTCVIDPDDVLSAPPKRIRWPDADGWTDFIATAAVPMTAALRSTTHADELVFTVAARSGNRLSLYFASCGGKHIPMLLATVSTLPDGAAPPTATVTVPRYAAATTAAKRRRGADDPDERLVVALSAAAADVTASSASGPLQRVRVSVTYATEDRAATGHVSNVVWNVSVASA
jgi:hypothetical protein